ncbi:LysM peptidoglycan-binding domain-containing protein [Cohnella rhizosphaerae]|uniref:LysM peptidoglycan-binding domain-containing protein n=1 Tax=Cohnella rhizosphaerae TaxID=1457232 RepID=A0A9X4QWC9_9BACL|nr:LysM peptidoglycan-binding domain-containing protein [Cohnella rhizosphaerae]MDG0813715.1 LysM peptidoglycan-binding domain-containing protein [Cohnella rhizosphaerae]
MTESSNGLRFDIYERVQLASDALPIDTLEEIELSPHIEALEQEDSVLLRGYLLLSGTYRPIGEVDSAGSLEHRIPVEISLPQSRVRQLEELDVEIDHFDVDLLTERSLNVTGVLGLRGVQTEAREAPVWHEDGFTVAHEAPERVSAIEAERRDEANQALSLPPLGESAFEPAAAIGTNGGFAGTSEAGRANDSFAAGGQPQAPVYSQPGPVYLPPAWTDPNAAQETAVSPVWYEQQRARAEAEARAREEALLREQELAQVAAEALERQLAEAARAEADRAARAAEEARAFELAEREKAEREALDAIARAERERQLEAERDRQEEAEAWERLLAYQRLEEEPAEFVAPAEAAPVETVSPQSEPPSYPQVYEAQIPAASAWPGLENDLQDQDQTESAETGEAARKGQRQPEPAGPKLGLSSKGSGGSESVFGVGILSQLGDKGAIREADLKAAEEARLAAPPENTQNSRASGDEIEWTRLFLAKEAGQSFRKVKMVIVQREDTLDGIAGKYQLQSRELQLYNRLPDPHLAEGQVLYIP